MVSLFGAASYIDPDELLKVPELLKPGGRFFLMFYADHYTPETHIKTQVFPHTYRRLPGLPAKSRVVFDNYVVMEGGRATESS